MSTSVITVTATVHLLAQAAAGPPSAGDAIISMLTPLVLVFFVFYFLMWRPQAKRQQEHQSFLNALKSGDEVVTAGGLLGTVRGVDGKVVTVEVAKGVKIKVLKSQVRGSRKSIVGDDGGDAAPSSEKSD